MEARKRARETTNNIGWNILCLKLYKTMIIYYVTCILFAFCVIGLNRLAMLFSIL